MTRKLGSTKIEVESTDPRIEPHQYTAGKSKYWINSVWMKILGIDDDVKVIMNENAKRQSMTLRSFLNLMCVPLENINRRQSIFYTSGGPFSKTAMKSTLLYFLNEEEFEEYKDTFYYRCHHRKRADGKLCDFAPKLNQDKFNSEVEDVIWYMVREGRFREYMRNKLDEQVDVSYLEDEKKQL